VPNVRHWRTAPLTKGEENHFAIGSIKIGLLLCALLPAAARAFDLPSSSSHADSTWTITSDYLEFRSTENAVRAQGNVVVVSSDTRLEADEAVVKTGSKEAEAWGNIRLLDGPLTLRGNHVEYNWDRSTGAVAGAYIENAPWRLWAKEARRVGEDTYALRRTAITNCDLDPPHYHFRGRFGTYVMRKRFTLEGGAVAAERTPLILLPFYTRSLKDRRYSLRIEPGRSGRDGNIVRTIYGYPLTGNTYGRLYYDWFELTGYGLGAEYNYFRPDVKGSVYGYRLEDRLDDARRWNLRVGHWQQLNPRLSLQANAFFQSDSDFSNRFIRDDLERVRQQVTSDAGLTYTNPYFSSRVSAEQDQIFDPDRNKFVRQRTALPRLSAQTAPLLLGASVYATLNGSFLNEYRRPQQNLLTADPLFPARDLFRQTANAGGSLSRTVALGKKTSLVPSAGISEEWQAWTVGATTDTINRKDVFQGRVFTGLNFRQRVTRALDYDLTHTYRVRWSPNSAKRDHGNETAGATDRGTEQNSVSLFLSYRPLPVFWARASSGYDLRLLQGNNGDREIIQTVRQKITPPSVEFSYRPMPWVELFYRQIELLYPVRKPQSTQFSILVGESNGLRFSSGWSYNVGTRHQVQIRHGAAFPVTKGWWVDGGIAYNASGERHLAYDSVQIIEKSLVVRRDLHCWTVKIDFRQRPGVEEMFFRIDLKSDLAAEKRLASPEEEQYYPGRGRDGDVP